MTCHEFIEAAESMTPLKLRLNDTNDEKLWAHSRECASCAKWAESKRLLGNALQFLSAETALREAGPKVEAAVLEAFRTQGFEQVTSVAADRAAPAAWKLSRFFEVGAYAAVAAALIVGIFLGARMWPDRQAPPAQADAQTSATSQQVNSVAATLAADSNPSKNAATEIARKPANPATTKDAGFAVKPIQPTREQAVATTADRQGFVALMFCDPLICSGEEQVIRMELPGNASASADGTGSQPVIADVVIGDDGLVRAMRIVNVN